MLILAVIVFLSLSLANPISFNISTTSLKRAPPENQACHSPAEWQGRYCSGNLGSRMYRDQCREITAAGVFPYVIHHNCPEHQQCFEYTDADGDHQIDCISVPRTPDRDDVATTKIQYGKRKFETQETPSLLRKVSVEVQHDIGPSSSVSGHIMG
jgi:hypothetical protein